MKRSQRMQPVRKLKLQEERQLAKKLAQTQQALAQEKTQLEMLHQYQRDYFASLTETHRSGGTQLQQASQLEKYQQFLSRLHKAIENQRQVYDIKEKAVEAARQEWAQANARLKALDNLIERMRLEEERQQDKREQRMIDDLPLRNNRYD